MNRKIFNLTILSGAVFCFASMALAQPYDAPAHHDVRPDKDFEQAVQEAFERGFKQGFESGVKMAPPERPFGPPKGHQNADFRGKGQRNGKGGPGPGFDRPQGPPNERPRHGMGGGWGMSEFGPPPGCPMSPPDADFRGRGPGYGKGGHGPGPGFNKPQGPPSDRPRYGMGFGWGMSEFGPPPACPMVPPAPLENDTTVSEENTADK
ncbi:MAG: hypothetical protein ACRC2T_04745 [Thermoguttaceae bacterium]